VGDFNLRGGLQFTWGDFNLRGVDFNFSIICLTHPHFGGPSVSSSPHHCSVYATALCIRHFTLPTPLHPPPFLAYASASYLRHSPCLRYHPYMPIATAPCLQPLLPQFISFIRHSPCLQSLPLPTPTAPFPGLCPLPKPLPPAYFITDEDCRQLVLYCICSEAGTGVS